MARLNQALPACPFDELLARRREHEPIAYILGEWEFFSLPLTVRPPMLVPRPETEHLVEVVLEYLRSNPVEQPRILEIGVGTGCVCVALAVKRSKALITGTDLNPMALRLARENAERHKVADRIRLLQADLLEAFAPDAPVFDVICSNPPYIEEGDFDELDPVVRLYEDPAALLAGPEGLDAIEQLAHGARGRLKAGGLLAFEMGMGQYGRVRKLLESLGFSDIGVRRDLAGIERIAWARA
jgi:release factor glutamine methyltransferase